MTSKRKAESDREVVLRTLDASTKLKIRMVDGILSILRTAVRGGILLGALYFGGVAIAPFAGRNTEVIALVKAMVDFKADRYFFLTTAVVATGGWWQERRNRKKLIREWGPYIQELETKIDPDRTSSGLLSDGQPTKEDANAL